MSLPNSVMRHSGSWLVQQFAQQFGDTISEPVVFGIGRTAWYCLYSRGAGVPFLLTYHPQRVERMFMAINVATETYHCWTTKPISRSEIYCFEHGNVLPQLDKKKLESGFDESGNDSDPRYFCVWPVRVIPPSDEHGWPSAEVRIPGINDPVIIEGEILARSWRACRQELAEHSFYLPYVRSVRWNRRVVIRLAIQQWIHQMEQRNSQYGVAGLDALAKLADILSEGDTAVWNRTRGQALEDGGASGMRDLWARFLEEAADELRDPVLPEAAALYWQVAELWSAMFAAVQPATEVARSVRHVLEIEKAALQMLQRHFS